MNAKLKQNVQDTLLVLMGSLISALALNFFIVPHKLLSGGVTGISLIIQYIFKIPAGIIILIMNIPLFILSIKFVSKRFTALTIVGTAGQSIFLMLTRYIINTRVAPVDDVLLSCIYGGAINGIGLGIIFANHGSSGGTDIISMILKKKFDMDIGKISFAFNILIIGTGGLLFGIETALYTLISLFISATVIDRVINGFNKRKMLLIVTEREDIVIDKINNVLHRTATILYGEGSYSKKQKNVIYCVVSLSQVPLLKRIILEADPNSFISILDTSEVHGKGFKMI